MQINNILLRQLRLLAIFWVDLAYKQATEIAETITCS